MYIHRLFFYKAYTTFVAKATSWHNINNRVIIIILIISWANGKFTLSVPMTRKNNKQGLPVWSVQTVGTKILH